MTMNNGGVSDTQTWVDLLNRETGINSSSNGGPGITISSQTPRTNRKPASYKPSSENEVLRSQVVNLLKEKQEIMKKVRKTCILKFNTCMMMLKNAIINNWSCFTDLFIIPLTYKTVNHLP